MRKKILYIVSAASLFVFALIFLGVLVKFVGKNNPKDCYILASENLVPIDLSKSNSAEFEIALANSPVSGYADEFSFLYLDSDRNKLDDSPVNVSELKVSKNKNYCTVTISAQKEGLYFVRCSHPLAKLNSDVLVVVKTKALQNQEKENSSYIVTSEKQVVIDLSKSDCADFGLILGDSPVSDYADGFSFSYLDLDGNVLDTPPVEVTGVKADEKNGCYKATVSAQKEGECIIRVSHKLALFSTDVLVLIRKGDREEFQEI